MQSFIFQFLVNATLKRMLPSNEHRNIKLGFLQNATVLFRGNMVSNVVLPGDVVSSSSIV